MTRGRHANTVHVAPTDADLDSHAPPLRSCTPGQLMLPDPEQALAVLTQALDTPDTQQAAHAILATHRDTARLDAAQTPPRAVQPTTSWPHPDTPSMAVARTRRDLQTARQYRAEHTQILIDLAHQHDAQQHALHQRQDLDSRIGDTTDAIDALPRWAFRRRAAAVDDLQQLNADTAPLDADIKRLDRAIAALQAHGEQLASTLSPADAALAHAWTPHTRRRPPNNQQPHARRPQPASRNPQPLPGRQPPSPGR